LHAILDLRDKVAYRPLIRIVGHHTRTLNSVGMRQDIRLRASFESMTHGRREADAARIFHMWDIRRLNAHGTGIFRWKIALKFAAHGPRSGVNLR
jgi:hypothetical protein